MTVLQSSIQDQPRGASLIRAIDEMPPIKVPAGHVGPVELPGTGRMVWWTGRVAIGLRHQPTRNFGPITQSAMWIQSVMLRSGSALASV